MDVAIRLEALPARLGDCLIVECLQPGKPPFRMLIDGGPSDTWPLLRGRIEDLPAGDRRFDIVIVTHIDSDHIGGMIPFFGSDLARDNIADVWFNGLVHLPNLTSRRRGGVAQATTLTAELLGDQTAPAFPWNRAFGGQAVATDPTTGFSEVQLDEGPRITVLSPTLERLGRLRRQWVSNLRKARRGVQEEATLPPEPMGSLDDLEELAGQRFNTDTSAPNGSSIAILLEHRGASCILSGDAFGGVLAEGLSGLAKDRGTNAIFVDAFKLPHHGSRANVLTSLVELAPACHYIVSSNGDTFGHPDDSALARVVVGAPAEPTLWFNYENARTCRWSRADLRDRYGHKTMYPTSEGVGAVVELAAGE